MKRKELKVGLAGLYFSNFEALKYKIYDQAVNSVREICSFLNLECICLSEPLETKEEAEQGFLKLKSDNVDFLILQTSSLCLGDVIRPFTDGEIPIGFWAVEEPTLEGELPLNSFTGFNLAVSIAHSCSKKTNYTWFYGNGEQLFRNRLITTLRALNILKSLRSSRIAVISGAVPTFDNLIYDKSKLLKSLGVEIIEYEIDDFLKKVERTKYEEASLEIADIRDTAAVIKTEAVWVNKTGKLLKNLKSFAQAEGLDALALRCWPEFQSVLGMAPCAAVARMNDYGIPVSCEGDVMGAVSMLMGFYITGNPVTMNDMVAADSGRDMIQMWHCGPGPAAWADDKGWVLDYHHTLNRRTAEGDPKLGLSADISFKRMAVTALRVSPGCDSLFVMEGDIVDGPHTPYPGSGGWMGNLRINGELLSLGDFIETIAVYGLEHHYPMMMGHQEDICREIASWTGMNVKKKQSCTSYRTGPDEV